MVKSFQTKIILVFLSLLFIFTAFILSQKDLNSLNYLDVQLPITTKTGYLTFQKTAPVQGTGNTFYWFVPNVKDDAPLIIWLTGGPACSDIFSALQENGPVYFDTQSKLVLNPYSWNKVAHVLYVDNPLNTGYSYFSDKTYYPSSAVEAAEDLHLALESFYSLDSFKKYNSRPIYIFGESYGGKFSIALAETILRKGKFNQLLQGIALGNGWVNPDVQASVYSPFAYTLGLTNYRGMVLMNVQQEKCHELIEKGEFYNADLQSCTPLWYSTIETGGGFNAYDYRLFGTHQSINWASNYMGVSGTLTQFGIDTTKLPGTDGKVELCSSKGFAAFSKSGDFQSDYSNRLGALLKQMKVLIYEGQYDIRCSASGVEKWLRHMNWEGKGSFNSLNGNIFHPNASDINSVGGLVKTYQNLTYLTLYGGGHLVPMDQRETSLEMVRRFLYSSGYPRNSAFCAPLTDCEKPSCPNQCSYHGTCDTATGTCICQENARSSNSDDCSRVRERVVFARRTTYEGYIFGKHHNTYHLEIGEHGVGLMDVKIEIERLSSLGKVHVYVHGARTFVEPDMTGTLSQQFLYYNTEDLEKRFININEIQRSDVSCLSIVVTNNVDAPVHYKIRIVTQVSGAKWDPQTIGAFVFLAVCVALSLVLLVVALVQRFYDSRRVL